MISDACYASLERLPGFWCGRAMMRLLLAEQCRDDPIMERHHASVAAQYEQTALRLARYQ